MSTATVPLPPRIADCLTPRRKAHVEDVVHFLWHNGRKVILEQDDQHYAALRDQYRLLPYQAEAALKDAFMIGVIDIRTPSRDHTVLELLSTDVDDAIRKYSRKGDAMTVTPELLAAKRGMIDPSANELEQLAHEIYEKEQLGESVLPAMRSVADLCSKNPELRPSVIRGVLRRGETMNLISAPKIGKSWLSMQLAISIASGRMWLDRFMVDKGEVLIIDNELHEPTLANRIPKVAAAMNVDLNDIKDTLYVESFRGQLRDVFAMDEYFRQIDKGRFKLIVVDAFYRWLPRDLGA